MQGPESSRAVYYIHIRHQTHQVYGQIGSGLQWKPASVGSGDFTRMRASLEIHEFAIGALSALRLGVKRVTVFIISLLIPASRIFLTFWQLYNSAELGNKVKFATMQVRDRQ